MRVLEGFSEVFQSMNSKVLELEHQVKELQREKEQLQEQVQRDAGKQQSIDWTHGHGRADDMEFER